MSRQSNWETTTVLSLFTGYAGYYVCRSVLSVASPGMVEDFVAGGMEVDVARRGVATIASYAVIVYAIGKLFGGVICEFVGGRRMFLLGMAVSIVCTLLFGVSSGLGLLTTIFCVNRLFQSTGWSALVKITASWFSFQHYGRVMGFLCLSYLFGDFLARKYLAFLLDHGLDWRELFFAAAGLLSLILVLCSVAIRSSPRDVGLPAPPVNPANLYGKLGEQERPVGIIALVVPLLGSFAFWLVCVMSVGLTIIREMFNFWLPIYLVETTGMSKGDAGSYSAYFPLFGAAGVLSSGYLTDMMGGKRGTYMVLSLAGLTVLLFTMTQLQVTSSVLLPLALVYGVGFLMMAPYAFLTGAISLDLGGKQASSTAAGLIDAVGYFGSSLALYLAADISSRFGWNAVFGSLAVMAIAAAVAALLYAWDLQRRHVIQPAEPFA